MNSDLRYLAAKHEPLDDVRWLTFVIRNFNERIVTEALRRVDGQDVSRPYFWGVCRNVAREP